MPYNDPKKQKESTRLAAQRFRDKQKGITEIHEKVIPDDIIPDQNVIPNVIPVKQPSEDYKEARYKAYKEGHLHEFDAGRG